MSVCTHIRKHTQTYREKQIQLYNQRLNKNSTVCRSENQGKQQLEAHSRQQLQTNKVCVSKTAVPKVCRANCTSEKPPKNDAHIINKRKKGAHFEFRLLSLCVLAEYISVCEKMNI